MLRSLTRAESGAVAFAVAIVLFYGVLPVTLYWWQAANPYYLQLAGITALGASCVVLGWVINISGTSRRDIAPRRSRAVMPFVVLVWGAFISFVVIACATAERIPIVAAVQGADGETLAILRERFLKAREGWESSFVYVNAAFAGALVPYSLMLAMVRRYRYRWILFGLFLLYCVSFVEKAYFFKAVIPLVYLVVQRKISSRVRPKVLIGGSVAVLVLITVAAGMDTRSTRPEGEEFFSTSFATRGAAQFLLWRSVAVPVVTAADTLNVFEGKFGGRPLMGASSALIAGLLGEERVRVERQVFAAQWGQGETETGSANATYLTEAFLNFGYPGVILFSIAVGMIFNLFGRSRDEAFRSLWMLFGMSVFVAPLTATLFSSGFLLTMVLARALKLDDRPSEAALVLAPREE